MKRYTNPFTALDGAKVRAATDSSFAVEVVVPPGVNAPAPAVGRTPVLANGLAYVRLQRGEVYRLRIHNTARFDVAVKVSIDGIDQFAFADSEYRTETGQPLYRHMVIAKGAHGDIVGWFRSLKSSDAFQVTEYAKSAAAELKASPAEVGVICVQFHAA